MSIRTIMDNIKRGLENLSAEVEKGTSGYRNVHYALTQNTVLISKLNALIDALDDLKKIKSKGGVKSRNIEKEAVQNNTLKPRDPNWRDMEAIRKSGAGGAHRDKKKELKSGKLKHKNQQFKETDMKINEVIVEADAGNELARLGRILMDKAVTQKDDALSNVMAKVGDELTRYGAPGGARTTAELEKKTGISLEMIEKLMKFADKFDDPYKKTAEPGDDMDMDDEMKDSVDHTLCSECSNPSWRTLSEEKQKGVDGKVCWKGYKRMGTKEKGGKTVDNCVKM